MSGTPSAPLRCVVDRLFESGGRTADPGAVGVELELIPRSVAGGPPPADAAPLERLARERRGDGRISFEPGGQLEFSTPALPSVAAVDAEVRGALDPLVEAARAAGIVLDARGLAPRFGPDEVGLRQPSARYVVMDRYFDRLGPWGAWMMRCTASLQVNLDIGPPGSAPARWRVANLLGPVLVASFANSAADLPDGTPVVSGRAWIWRRVDPDRTGARGGGPRTVSPRQAYLDFALRAPVMFDAGTRPVFLPDGRIPRFGEWWEARSARRAETIEDWRVHLGTLFPDVRPRGWLEIRPVDVPQPAWWSVPAAFLAALLYDRRALREADALLGVLHATPDLSVRALTAGLGDATLRSAASAAFELAEAAMARLPGGFFGDARRATAAFRERFVEAGRTQADEAREAGEVTRLRTVAAAGSATGASLPPRSS